MSKHRLRAIVLVLVPAAIALALGACTSDVGGRPPGATEALTTATSLASKDPRLAKSLEARAAGEGWESEASGDGAFTSPGWRGAKEQRWSELGARLPARADGAIEVGVSQFPATRLRLVPEGAKNVEGKLRDGHVVYAGAYGAGIDVVMTTTRESIEELFVLRASNENEGANRSVVAAFAWDVALPTGIAHAVVKKADGGLELQDARGERVLGIPAAYATDARGTRRSATLAWDGGDGAHGRLRVELDTRGLAFPVLLDPSFEVARWDEVTAPSLGGQIEYDAARGRVVRFGTDTSTWDGNLWTKASPGQSPTAVSAYAMAYDALHTNVVLFGGRLAGRGGFIFGAELNRTWTWDGTTWNEVFPLASPPPTSDHRMVYDAARGNVVLVTIAGDTWTFDGATWTKAAPPASPPGRKDFALAYDAARGKVLLFGGSDGLGTPATHNDTWTWDGATWTEMSPAASPPQTSQHAMAYDAGRGVVVLFGGLGAQGPGNGTWTWNGTTWTQAVVASPPAARSSHSMTYDAARDRVVVYGGLGASNDTLLWDGTSWTSQPAPAPAPAARQGHAMAWDGAHSRVVLFGGSSKNDTWTWDGTSWFGPLALGPSGRTGHAMAYDGVRGNVVLFGGIAAGAAQNDTWTWNGTAWNNAGPPTSPPPMSSPVMAFDKARGNMVLFGNGLTWTWNGTTWKDAMPPTSPSSRIQSAMASDDAHGKVVLFGGLNGDGLGDTWTWNGTTWTAAAAAIAPAARWGHAMAYDSRRGKVVLFGGYSGDLTTDTWVWDGLAWSSPSSSSPPGTFQPAMAFDGARGKVILFAGQFDSNRTWLYSARSGGCAVGSQCDSGFCTDGVCCEVPTCGTCQACNHPTKPGICAAVTNAVDDTCSGTKACDAVGLCRPGVGQACTKAAQCASGFCTDGVCCDTACAGQCESCGVANSKGACIRIQGVPQGGRPACGRGPEGNLCAAPACNGVVAAACAGFAGAEVACRAPSCKAGVVSLPASCKGNGFCPDLVTATCAPYACAGNACGTTCNSDAECDGKFSCDVAKHVCVPRGAAACDGDHTLVAPSGTSTDCAPYKCEGSACKATCNSILDCAYPSECDGASHTCVPTANDASSASGCAMSASRASGPADRAGAWLAAACLAALLRRRARLRDPGAGSRGRGRTSCSQFSVRSSARHGPGARPAASRGWGWG